MLPDIHRATQKFYIFLIVYLTGCTPQALFVSIPFAYGKSDLIYILPIYVVKKL